MGAYAKIEEVFLKYKNQTKMKNSATEDKRYIFLLSKEGIFSLTAILVMSFFTAGFSLVSATNYQQQINALSQQNNRKQARNNQLGVQAANLNDAISKLQAQIDAKQAVIYKHQQEVEKLKVEIAQAQKELDQQRRILGADIKAMYLEGDISTLEMLATSKNLSDYFDKQQYRQSVQDKVKNTLDKITQLKLDLNTKKVKTEELIREQQQLKNQLVSQRSEKNHLLSLNQTQRSALDKSIRANNAKIAQLRAAQALANRQLSAGGAVIAGDPGHGGYPSVWANSAQDSMLDNWGLYNRECVSYTAWKVYQTYGFMPYWGGHGNANEWPGDARAAGIPTGSTPRMHSVAIWNVGYYGHAMWVEAVNSDGSLWVSQYNYDYHGHYSEMRVSASMAASLTYIYFH